MEKEFIILRAVIGYQAFTLKFDIFCEKIKLHIKKIQKEI